MTESRVADSRGLKSERTLAKGYGVCPVDGKEPLIVTGIEKAGRFADVENYGKRVVYSFLPMRPLIACDPL